MCLTNSQRHIHVVHGLKPHRYADGFAKSSSREFTGNPIRWYSSNQGTEIYLCKENDLTILERSLLKISNSEKNLISSTLTLVPPCIVLVNIRRRSFNVSLILFSTIKRSASSFLRVDEVMPSGVQYKRFKLT
ncbi:hypothetical protein ACTFIU_005703 [Dictyostelium citrinum]